MKVTCTLVVQQDDGHEKAYEIDPVSVEYGTDLLEYRPNAAATPSPARKVFIEGLLHGTTERKIKMTEDKKPLFYEAHGGSIYNRNLPVPVLTVHVGTLMIDEARQVVDAVLAALNAEDWSGA